MTVTVRPSDVAALVAPRGSRAAGDAADESATDATDDTPPSSPPSSAPPRRCRGRRRFRSVIKDAPVVGFTGPNGAGKTLVAVSEVLRDLHAERPVFSTVPVECDCGLTSRPILSLRQLLEIRDATILIDEVSVVFSSRMTGSLPDEVSTFLQTMRHQGVTLRWTAPAWARADIQLREVTQVSVPVTGVGRIRVPGKFWPRPLLVGVAALDTTSVELDKVPERVMFGSRRIWVPQHLPGWGSYDSEADVSRIGWARQGRVCVDCGGSRRAEPCSPERHQALGIPVLEVS